MENLWPENLAVTETKAPGDYPQRAGMDYLGYKDYVRSIHYSHEDKVVSGENWNSRG